MEQVLEHPFLARQSRSHTPLAIHNDPPGALGTLDDNLVDDLSVALRQRRDAIMSSLKCDWPESTDTLRIKNFYRTLHIFKYDS